MSNREIPVGTQVDPSESAIDEGQSFEQENYAAAEGEGQDAAARDEDDASGRVNAE